MAGTVGRAIVLGSRKNSHSLLRVLWMTATARQLYRKEKRLEKQAAQGEEWPTSYARTCRVDTEKEKARIKGTSSALYFLKAKV